MRLTIERMRTLVLAAGVLLIVALVGFLVAGRWKRRFNFREIPKRLGVNIQQEANGVTYTQSHGGHTLFKIHASKVEQQKKGNALLHDVQIELYGEDGTRVDRIEGKEFEYDQKGGQALARGPVEITLMRPGVAPAVAPKATTAHAVGDKSKGGALEKTAQAAETGQIHVKTSGLTFDQASGVATTTERVEFDLEQGNGTSMGATFDSQNGKLVLDHAVELNVRRGANSVLLHAQHAEFERGELISHLKMATAHYRNDDVSAGAADLLFRDDGSVVRLDASDGFTLATSKDGHVAAPRGTMDFDEQNQPKHGRMDGGVTMDSSSEGRQVHGTAPTAILEFDAKGQLHHAHLERGVTMHSTDRTLTANGAEQLVTRDWHSPVADVEFRNVGQGQPQLASIHGIGGVVITGETQRGNAPATPERMAADDVQAEFGAGQNGNSELTAMTGLGHAVMEQTTATGARQTTSGDRLDAKFTPDSARMATASVKNSAGLGAAAQIQMATVDGNVVLMQFPAPRTGQPAAGPLRATAGHAVYEGAGEWLHLTVHPRIEDAALQMTADLVDVSQASGDAFAHGNVKATWLESSTPKNGAQRAPAQGSLALGGKGPAHVIASEAQLHQPTGEVTFQGQARLWQEANSVAAPLIILDRVRQTLVARSSNAADPVRVVLLSAGGAADHNANAAKKPAGPSVIRVRAGDLKYSDAERKAVLHGGAIGAVVAETGMATSVSNELDMTLLLPGNHAAKDGGAAQVDRMTARGHVSVSSQGRRGTGEQLVYSSDTDHYVLTGTSASPPRMTDPTRGTVTGEALIFNGRDDSVTVDGGGRKTTTETTAPK